MFSVFGRSIRTDSKGGTLMKITVLHDEHGAIVAISRIENLHSAGSKFTKVGMMPAAGQHMIEVELSGEEEQQSVKELHESYRVDVSTHKLIKR
jgi:hypothetical protein